MCRLLLLTIGKSRGKRAAGRSEGTINFYRFLILLTSAVLRHPWTKQTGTPDK